MSCRSLPIKTWSLLAITRPDFGDRKMSNKLRPVIGCMIGAICVTPAASINVGARSAKLTKSVTTRPRPLIPFGQRIASGMWFEDSYACPFTRGKGMP